MAGTKLLLSSRETQYINSWIVRYGRMNVYKYRNIPEIILNQYEADLIMNSITFAKGTSNQRIQFIERYIDFVVNVEPRYRKLLKLWRMKGYEIGLNLDYKNAITWYRSYKRYTYIRFLVTMIGKHEEMLNKLQE